MRWLIVAVTAVVLGCAVACGQQSPSTPIDLASVPSYVTTTAQKNLTDVRFESAVTKGDRYELRGHNSQGQYSEIEVNLSGEVIEIEGAR